MRCWVFLGLCLLLSAVGAQAQELEPGARRQIDPEQISRGAMQSPAIDRNDVAIQRSGAVTGNVPVFRASGGDRVSADEEPTLTPAPLPPDRMRKILTQLGAPESGSLYARLTPSGPEAPGKGALVFVKPNLVEGGEGFALFENNEGFGNPNLSVEERQVEGYFVLWLWSPTNRRYLIDCAVSGKYWHWSSLQGPEFRVAGPDAVQIFNFRHAFDPEGYHLVFSLEAGSPGWFPFQISTLPAGEAKGAVGDYGYQNTIWKLHSCEVTNL